MLQRLRHLIGPPAVEIRTVELAGTAITYTLKRTRRRRSIGLRIDDDGLTVNVPQRASEKWLHTVLQEKADWVVEKLDNWQTRKPPAQQWLDGEAIPFRGESLTLRIVPSLFDTPPQLQGTRLFVHLRDVHDAAAIRQCVQAWYQQEAQRLFEECVAHYAPLMGVSPRAVKLSSARTQWGSCTTSGTVRLNWQLVRMPLPLIDYVVVHELAHLLEMNHSAAFWRVVGKACPDYARLRRELHKWSPAAG
jgi:predicted metal-dependent hydrolase